MTDTASITFTGKVSRVHRFENGGQIIDVESDLGGKFTAKCALKGPKLDSLDVSEGDTVSVKADLLPSSGKPWQKKERNAQACRECGQFPGEWKQGKVEYYNPTVTVTSERDAAPDLSGDDIPF